MTLALPAERASRLNTLDLSWPILILFAVVLCVLIILPLSWLVYYSLVDRTGAFTLDNFKTLITDTHLRRSADHHGYSCNKLEHRLLRVRGAHELAGRAQRHAAAAHRARVGDRLLRNAPLSRRDCMGASRRPQQRAP